MPIPVLTALLLILMVWLQYEIRKNNKHSKKDNEEFWLHEKNSNLARRKDISQLNYITIDLNLLPMTDHLDASINSYRDTIRDLSDKKILNLTGLTNTELKYEYGVANINHLSEYDNNYTVLVRILQKWADCLYSQGYVADARSVLEFAVSCGTDVTKSYKLLADIYREQNTPDKIDHLIEIIQETKISAKDNLINEIMETKIL